MKKINYYALLAAAMLVQACSFLEEAPVVSVTEKDVYDSEAGLEAAVQGVYYSGLNTFTQQGYFYYLGSASRFQVFTGNRNTMEFNQTHDLTMYSSSTYNLEMYSRLYAGINAANKLIDGLDGSPVDVAYKVEIEAEARFLRALYYFTLTRLYGDVPLVLDAVYDEAPVNVPRTPYQTVYKAILDDLEYAEDNMRSAARQAMLNPDTDRCHSMAATALKAKVYTWMACYMESPFDQFFDVTRIGRYPDFSDCGLDVSEDAWEAALEAAETVIESKLYGLESDYRNLYRFDEDNYPDDYRSKERIIAVSSTANGGAAAIAKFTLWHHPYGSDASQTESSNEGKVRGSRWMWDKWASSHGGVQQTEGTVKFYESCPDPRFDATYMHTVYYTYTDGVLSANLVYPGTGVSNGNASSCPYFKKYFSTKYRSDNGYADYYVLRYADVLLMAAEAAASLSNAPGDENWDKAVDYMNILLERARKSVDEGEAAEPAAWTSASFTSKEELIDAIMWERFYETNGEFQEWFESHRRGAAWLKRNVCAPLLKFLSKDSEAAFKKQSFNDNTESLERSVSDLRASLLLAFPVQELRRNSSLSEADQNDFYIQ